MKIVCKIFFICNVKETAQNSSGVPWTHLFPCGMVLLRHSQQNLFRLTHEPAISFQYAITTSPKYSTRHGNPCSSFSYRKTLKERFPKRTNFDVSFYRRHRNKKRHAKTFAQLDPYSYNLKGTYYVIHIIRMLSLRNIHTH